MAIVKNPVQWKLLFAIVILLASHSSFAAKRLTSVADLRYGVTLYEYYQGNHFEALSELMVAEARNGIQGHGNNPKLIEGGISLSFGMEQKAGEIFAELLKPNEKGDYLRPLEVRNAAWFYLGKLRYLRGDWDGAEKGFANVTGKYDEQLAAELEALSINLAIRRDDLATAEKKLKDADYIDDWQHYLYFNMGNAYSRTQNFATAQKYYDRLAGLAMSPSPIEREEQLILYDKALTAAGYTYILQNKPDEAIEQFQRVRLKSDFSDRALLGFGWAAVEKKDYRLALKPWQVLAKRSLLYPAVQEAVIAVPYAYEQLGANGQALQSYLNAENEFQTEIARIDTFLAEVQTLDLMSALKIKDSDNRNWLMIDEDAGIKPHLTYLTELFSLNQFQGSVQELRDLLHIENQLAQWQSRLDAYDYMLDQRELDRNRQLQAIEALQLETKLASLQQRRDQLVAELNRIRDSHDYLALLDEEQLEYVDMVQSVARNIETLTAAGEPVNEYLDMLRRYYGLLYWQGSEVFSEKQWSVQREINDIDRVMTETRDTYDRLNRIITEAPDIEPYRVRINALNQRVLSQYVQAGEAVIAAENTLRGAISNELIQQKTRLQHYLSQARLSVARLYDLAANPQPLVESE